MITIRPAQMKTFEDAALRQFEDDMVSHLKAFAPEHCAAIGDDAVRQVVRTGMDKAQRYGLTNRGPVRFFLELKILFGSEFDTDPHLPWALQTLNDPKLPEQMAKADRLYERFLKYEQEVAGPNSENALEALRRTRAQRIDDLPPLGRPFETEVLARLRSVYPAKCAYVGEPRLRALLVFSQQLAEKHALLAGPAVALFTGLAFALGHGFIQDPLYPWVADTLGNDAIPEMSKRVERVHSKMMTYLDGVLKTFS
jgi:hypothetical protein